MANEFCIDGVEHEREPLSYRVSGLDDPIILLNGFTRHDTDYGAGVSIENIDGLHVAIALNIIATRKALTPKEFRFLRREMDVTQSKLGSLIGVDGQTIARYEKGETRITGPADRVLRLIFVLRLLPLEQQREILDRMQEALENDEGERRTVTLAETEGHWEIRQAV